VDQIKSFNPDFIIVAAYGKILPKDILDIPKYCCLNVHASLLPRWRGASPIQHAILAGDRATGVTVMKMEEGLDTGPVFLKSDEIAIETGDNSDTLGEKLASAGASLITSAMEKIAAVYLRS
jgi:methionyl-tRNA formyltransferase